MTGILLGSRVYPVVSPLGIGMGVLIKQVSLGSPSSRPWRAEQPWAELTAASVSLLELSPPEPRKRSCEPSPDSSVPFPLLNTVVASRNSQPGTMLWVSG